MSVIALEPWVKKDRVAHHFDSSIRWVEQMVAAGMPSAMIAGKRKFKLSVCEDWLEKEGFLER